MTAPGTSSTWLRVNPGCADVFAEGFAALSPGERLGANTHTAKKGDTPNAIAKKAGITVTVLRRYNPKLKTNAASAIPVGTKVLVPTKNAVIASREVADPAIERWGGASVVASAGTYVIRRGDTLGGIALRHSTTVAKLKSLNGMQTERIVAGQKLRIR
jgi:LysM repeat protein